MSSDGHPFGLVSVQRDHFPLCIWLLYVCADQTKLMPSPGVRGAYGVIMYNDSLFQKLYRQSAAQTLRSHGVQAMLLHA